MEALGTVCPDLQTSSQQKHRPVKRKRLSHPESNSATATHFSRPRGLGMIQNGSAQLQIVGQSKEGFSISSISHATGGTETPLAQTALVAPVQDTGLQMPQAYHDPQLHDTGTDRSGHHYVSTMPLRNNSDPVVRSSVNGSGAMSIASSQPTTEDNFAPASSSPSLNSDAVGQTYNPTFQHQQQWPNPAQTSAISSHPHFHTLPQSQSQSHSLSQPVPPSFINNGASYPTYDLVLPQGTHAMNTGLATALSANSNVAVSGPQPNTLSSHVLGTSHPGTAGICRQDSLHGHHHHHHHQQQQGAFFPTHQTPPGFDVNQASYRAPVTLAAIPYAPQFEPNVEAHHPHKKPHRLDPDSYNPAPMGGGQFLPGHQQLVGGNGFPNAMNHAQNIHYGIHGSTMAEMTGSLVSSRSHTDPPHDQTSDEENTQVDRMSSVIYDDMSNINTHEATADGSGDMNMNSMSPEAPQDLENSANQEQPQIGIARKRGPLDPQHRRQTAETRKRKACTRCRTQKMRCETDLDDKNGPCIPCKSFSKTSKKTIHLAPCFRGKLTDAVLYRSGGLGLTRRWSGTEMKDVGDRINPEDIRNIKFTLGIWKVPIEVKVVAFHPLPTDVTARFWTVHGEEHTDVRKKKDLAYYCLADIQDAAAYFEKYIHTYALEAILEQRTGPVRLAGQRPALLGVIEKTYLAAVKHYECLKAQVAEGSSADINREFSLMHNLFVLWFATRHTTGSSYICGEETLSMKPEMRDDSYPLFGKVSVPRMIVAQFDSINHTRLLAKYGKKVLMELETLIMRNQPRWWFTIYLCIFILLREASWSSEDRYRHARQNYGKNTRYSIPSFVQSLHEGCNNLLQHWHYYNCRPWPDPGNPWERHKSFLSELSPEQYDLIMETMEDRSVQKQLGIWKRYKNENGHLETPEARPVKDGETDYQGYQSRIDWDHPFYWISQLFEEHWQPHPTYQAEYH